MNKLFCGIIMLLGSVLPAHSQNEQPDSTKVNMTKVVEINIAEDPFSPIEPSKIPVSVRNVVAADYPTSKIINAYVNKAKQYKLKIVLENGRSGYLYVDRDGNWIER